MLFRSAFNQALMELGGTVCLPNGAPLCERCPGRSLCAALAHGRTGELPVKAPKKPRRVEERTVWLIFWENRAALRRRPGRGLLAGLWEFPSEPGVPLLYTLETLINSINRKTPRELPPLNTCWRHYCPGISLPSAPP